MNGECAVLVRGRRHPIVPLHASLSGLLSRLAIREEIQRSVVNVGPDDLAHVSVLGLGDQPDKYGLLIEFDNVRLKCGGPLVNCFTWNLSAAHVNDEQALKEIVVKITSHHRAVQADRELLGNFDELRMLCEKSAAKGNSRDRIASAG